MNAKKNLLLGMLSFVAMIPATMSVSAAADDQGFDLNSQRSERQEFAKVPGHKVDHQGIVVNPTPQKFDINRAESYRLPAARNIKDVKKSFGQEIDDIVKGGIDLKIDYGKGPAKKRKVEARPEAYRLTITPKGIEITGYDEAGAFYGLQTLRQLLNSEVAAATGTLPAMDINDWPSIPRRGVIEGFYGEPWSHEVRLSLIDYYGKNKLNSYFYGPKDDPYHSVPNWRLPYPADEAAKIKELVEASNRNHVDFIWAIHPGADIRWNKEDYDSLVNKLDMMYDLGVRSFAVFFDDIDGEGRNPHKQVELLNNLNNEFVKQKGDVSNMVICPTDYSRLWASPDSTGALATYGRDLDKSIEVFYTGDVVCSDLTHDTMNFFNSLIKRPGFWWWNYPVSDYVRHMILQGPVYGLETTITSDDISGFASNPMEHGEASKLALYGVADYSWNPAAYNPLDNWERGLVDLTPEAAEAYRTFAIHSADTETGYRRDESWETEIFRLADYTPAKSAALRAEFERVEAAPQIMENNCTNQLLMKELRPWLTEFSKLGKRGQATLDVMDTYLAGNDSTFWTAYVGSIFTPEQRKAWEAHKSGTMKLQPFIDNAMDDMIVGFYSRLTGEVPTINHGMGSFRNLRTTLANLMFDNDTTTYYTSASSQGKGDWIGADMGQVRPVDRILIKQGRNNVDDVDYFDNVVLQSSIDGRVWTDLTDPLVKTYDIVWSSEQPVQARYLRLNRLDSKRSNWASVREFSINPMTLERLGFTLEATDPEAALLAFDGNPISTAVLNEEWIIPAEALGHGFILLSNPSAAIVVTQLDSKGKVVATEEISRPWATVTLVPNATKVALKSTGATIHEIIKR